MKMNRQILHYRLRGSISLACLSAILALAPECSYAQNMVPNGDFESYNACPGVLGGIDYSPAYNLFPTVKDWVVPIQTSPDYMNSCATQYYSSTPTNQFGHQVPHSGNAYVGMITVNDIPSQPLEYISAKLNWPMTKDSIYLISFFVNTADGGASGQPVVANNDIGAHISSTYPTKGIGKNLSLSFDVSNDTNRHLTDMDQWYEIRGEFVAQGGEEWITIGRFLRPGGVPAFSVIRPGQSGFAYNYVDDVSIVPFAKNSVAVNNTTQENDIHIFPNPTKDVIKVRGLSSVPGKKTISLFDITGRLVSEQNTSQDEASIITSVLSNGMYMLRVRTGIGSTSYRIEKN